jgi:MoxR-like ATPase
MQEYSVTIAGQRYDLERPFFVLATQNPIEQEGTYPLPEAQVDRFMLKVVLGYPTKEEEKMIIRANVRKGGIGQCNKVIGSNDILRARELVREIYLDEKVEQYIVDLVYATRTPESYGLGFLQPLIGFGCSPRASINLALAGKAYAFLQGRAFVTPDDIRAITNDVMGHRIGLTYEAEAENVSVADVLKKIVDRVEVP